MKKSSRHRFHRMQEIEKGLLRGDQKARSSFLRITSLNKKQM
jgi:hypothetical protein